jgi:hypothetical protein
MYKGIRKRENLKYVKLALTKMSKSLHLNKLSSVIGRSSITMRDMSQRSGSQEVVRPITIAQLKMKNACILCN